MLGVRMCAGVGAGVRGPWGVGMCVSQHHYTCTKDTPKRLMPTHPERFEMKPNVEYRASRGGGGGGCWWLAIEQGEWGRGAEAAAVSGLVSVLL